MATYAALAAAFLFSMSAVAAHAQCAFDRPAKAKGFKSSLVRAYAGCPGITFAGPNSVAGGSAPSCAPPYAYSRYRFDDSRSRCTFKATVYRPEMPCSLEAATYACLNMKVYVDCYTVMHPDKDTPVSGPQDDGWELSTVLRITMNDPDGGDMTLVTLPVRVALHQPHGGTIDLNTNMNRMLADLGLAPLPGCAQIEFLSMSIQDPDGAPFAVLGAGTR